MHPICRCLLTIPLLTSLASAHSILATYAHQNDAPLEIVGMVNSPSDLASRIDLKNNSDKTIVEFQLGWTTVSPVGCSPHPIEPTISYARPEEVNLKSGQQSYSLSYRIGTSRTKNLAIKLESKHLFLQFGVVHVKFEDGSLWEFNLRQRKSFGDDLVLNEFACTPEFELKAKQAPTCGAPFTLKGLDETDGPILQRGPNTPQCSVCEYQCILTSNFTNCTIINNPAPGCSTDDLGRCCYTTNAQNTYYRVCYLHCRTLCHGLPC
jgi:hypothetical protein